MGHLTPWLAEQQSSLQAAAHADPIQRPSMAKIHVPARRPEDWRPLLANPIRHWRVGHSAYELAYSWQCAAGLPSAVHRVLDASSFTAWRGLELLIAIPERRVALPGG